MGIGTDDYLHLQCIINLRSLSKNANNWATLNHIYLSIGYCTKVFTPSAAQTKRTRKKIKMPFKSIFKKQLIVLIQSILSTNL